jgi:hypothetical protein
MSVWKAGTAETNDKLYINLDRVQAIWRAANVTVIRFSNDDKLSILETPDEFLMSNSLRGTT